MNKIHQIERFSRNKKTYVTNQGDLLKHIKNTFAIDSFDIEIKETQGGEMESINRHWVFVKDIQYTTIPSFTFCAKETGSNSCITTHLLNYEHPRDEYFVDQWYLFSTNVLPVWKDYTGMGVKIAVYDDDCILKHADLGTVNSSKSLCEPQSSRQHALAVAGIISAIPNTIGTIGIAHNAKVESIQFSLTNTSSYGFSWASEYDVISNSWAQMKIIFDYTKLPKFFHKMLMDIKEAATIGRNGFGTIFVFAAGNEYAQDIDPNFDIRKHNPYSIVVGGYNMPNYEEKFASNSALILVSAPCTHFPILQAVNIRTEQDRVLYDSGVMLAHGVSFAAPVVTSIVALMFEANNKLSWREVKEVLAISALYPKEKLKDANINHAVHINGKGALYSRELGFGVVNALGAVRLAEVLEPFSNYQKCQNHSSSIAFEEFDRKGIYKLDYAISSQIQLEYVRIYVEMELPYPVSEYSITLLSPTGTSSLLMYRPEVNPVTGELVKTANDVGLKLKWIFGSENFRGEWSQGKWEVHVFNHIQKAPVPKLISSIIELTGAENRTKEIYFTPNLEHINNNTYEVTIEPSTHTINTVTITENVIIDLSGENACFMLNKHINISNIELINNIKAGNGDDILIGNENDNNFWPGRGNDIIKTGSGNDVIIYANLNYKNIGHDVILDFDVNFDKIQIRGHNYEYLSTLFTENEYSNAVIKGDSWSIELYNVSITELGASNFISYMD